MHILVVASWYKTADAPIAGNFFEDQARMLAGRGHRVAVFWPQWSGSFRAGIRAGFTGSDQRYDDEGIPTYHQKSHPILPRDNFVNALYFARRVRDFASRYEAKWGRPDIIHAHSMLWAGYAGTVLREKWRVPLVVTEHNSGLVTRFGSLSPYLRRLIESVGTSADFLVCVSSTYKEDLAALYGSGFKRAHVIGNIVSDAFLTGPLTRPPASEFSWINVGSLIPVKRHALLLEAFRRFIDEVPAARLEIVGDGPLRRALEDQADALQVRPRVLFTGTLSRAGVVRSMARSHALVSTSTYETFGLAIAEGLAMGRPVVTTSSGGPSDYVSSTNGLFAQSDSPEGVAASMARMYRDYGNYSATVVRQSMARQYANDVIHQKTAEVYSLLLGSNAHRDGENANP